VRVFSEERRRRTPATAALHRSRAAPAELPSGRARSAVACRIARLDSRFDHVEGVVLRKQGERIARLEAAHRD